MRGSRKSPPVLAYEFRVPYSSKQRLVYGSVDDINALTVWLRLAESLKDLIKQTDAGIQEFRSAYWTALDKALVEHSTTTEEHDAMSSDALTGRRKKVKLGMTVEAPKKPGPFEVLGKKIGMDQGGPEEDRLEKRGRRFAGREAAKTQGKIPKAKPDFRKRGVRA